MLAEIFKITKDGDFLPTANALGVPEFYNLWFNVKDPDLYFRYIHYVTFPFSAYNEYPEEIREQKIHEDFPIDKTNPYFIIALQKAEQMVDTPERRAFLAAKHIYDVISGSMISLEQATFGKDGNYTDLAKFLQSSAENMKNYNNVKNQYGETVSLYGTRELAFDDDFDYSEETPDMNDE